MSDSHGHGHGQENGGPRVLGRVRSKKVAWFVGHPLTLINTLLIIVTGVLTIIGWFPKWRLDQLSYAAHRQTPTVPSSELSVEDLGPLGDGTHCYSVGYDVSMKNQAEQSLQITYAIAQLFVGERKSVPLSLDQAYQMNDPPNPWDRSGQGQIAWRPIAYDASLIDGKVPKEVQDFLDAKGYKNLSPGGGMTGIVVPGDTTEEDARFIVRARPDQYIGAVVSYGMDNETKSPNSKINLTADYSHLEDAEAEGTRAEASKYCGHPILDPNNAPAAGKQERR